MATPLSFRFFYGLHMDSARLRERGLQPGREQPGSACGYRLHLGAKAMLLPAAGAVAPGRLIELSEADFAALYREEPTYEREELTIFCEPGRWLAAPAMIHRDPPVHLPPDPAYHQAWHELTRRLHQPTTTPHQPSTTPHQPSTISNQPTATTVGALRKLFHTGLEKLAEEIRLYRDEARMWVIDGRILNSGGNLCLHLLGNLKIYLGLGLAGLEYVRDRPAEFSLKHIPRAELLRGLEETRSIVDRALERITDAALSEVFPMVVWDAPTQVNFTLAHLACHLHYHLGQVNYHRRLLDR